MNVFSIWQYQKVMALTRANFTQANFTQANFTRANFTRANFTWAKSLILQGLRQSIAVSQPLCCRRKVHWGCRFVHGSPPRFGFAYHLIQSQVANGETHHPGVFQASCLACCSSSTQSRTAIRG
ncbi:MAG: pentapeptide repeat-containing protein [Pirellula sp.]|nr:pentapeptide repeat-containing protein [Pirellula sp.]